MAGEDIGKAEIEVTADTSGFPSSVKRGVEESLHDTDPTFKKAGEDWGDEASKSFGQRLKFKFPEVIRNISKDLNREKITQHVKVEAEYDKDNVRSTVRRIASDIESEFVSSGAGGKIGGAIGSTITDAIGSAFNVSGKSPLIYLLIPTFGAIGALIAGAVEAVYGLGAALLTIPNLIAAIALQAGVLYLAFQAISEPLSKALAAQNWIELAAAIKGLNPYLQNFILEVVYIRDAFRDIGKYVSIDFFKALGNTLLDVFDYNRYTLFHGLADLATNLGTWFSQVGKAFESPQFAKYLSDLFKEINKFLATNGPTLQKFLTQVFGFLDSLMGATGDVGGLFNEWLKSFGDFLAETAKSKEFQDFLKEMPGILREVGPLLLSLLDLVFALLQSTDKAGGKNFITQLTGLIMILSAFLTSDLGIKGMEFLLITLLILTAVFIDLVIIIIGFFGLIQSVGDWLANKAWPAIRDFFKQLGENLAKAFSPHTWGEMLDKVGDAFKTFIDKAPGWGARLLQGFIDGITSKLGPLGNVLNFIGKQISDHLKTGSPAKAGPLSKDGGPEGWGQKMIDGFAQGIMAGGVEVKNASNSVAENINFGPGAVIANFYGQNPTPQQAQTLGTALGGGINDQLAARNARLAVRTM